MNRAEEIAIAGGGPVGSLLSIYLSQLGYKVQVFEKRRDPRLDHKTEGRSINLALSHRGLKALEQAGLKEKILEASVPMKGRMIHDEKGNLSFQPYGLEGQMIHSVSRNLLNELIIDKAEKEHSVAFHFERTCEAVDPDTGTLSFSMAGKPITSPIPAAIFGADGAFSAIRRSFGKYPDFTQTLENLSHSYKELHMPPGQNGTHGMEKNALHIWPREQFMLIALPNADGSFTCTLFLPDKGSNGFEALQTKETLKAFFIKYFPDAIPLLTPDFETDFFAHPPARLSTVHCFPWTYNTTLIVGDAAHAITPFYGQGMNAGFEDCRILKEMITENEGDWKQIFREFQNGRKENAEAIAQLALQNFIEMRDLVADPDFLLRKKIESEIHKKYPAYLPLYTMVTFSDIPYKEALQKGKEHDRMMEKIMGLEKIKETWNTPAGWKQIETILSSFINK